MGVEDESDLPTETVALKYKELWQVEQVFRDMKSILETRPIYHQMDETIRGHVFCSFLALVLRKELDRRLDQAGHSFEWADIKQDLKSLQEITIEGKGRRLAIRSECRGVCGKVFQSVGCHPPRFGRYDVLPFSFSKGNLWCQELFEGTYVPIIPQLYFCSC
jgi:transposase